MLNLLFATLYAVDPNSIAGTTGGRWFYDCFFFSVQTLATVGYGHMYPQTLYGHVVSMIEIMSGIFLLAVLPDSFLSASRARWRALPLAGRW